METLTPIPGSEFRALDEVVSRNLQVTLDFLNAIREIHERKLYLDGGFTSWEAYCQSRNVSRVHGLRLVKADKIRKSIEGKCNPGVTPTSEKHLRVIAKAPEEVRPVVVQEAQKRASDAGREPTTRDYEEAVKSVSRTKAEAVAKPPKVFPRHADQPEDYVDDEGYPVPEYLWDVWRDIPEFLDVVNGIRSSGCLESARKLTALGHKHKSPAVIRIGQQLERLHSEMVSAALSAKPSRVDGDDWLCSAEL